MSKSKKTFLKSVAFEGDFRAKHPPLDYFDLKTAQKGDFPNFNCSANLIPMTILEKSNHNFRLVTVKGKLVNPKLNLDKINDILEKIETP